MSTGLKFVELAGDVLQIFFTKYRKQEALEDNNEVLGSKAFNHNPSPFIQTLVSSLSTLHALQHSGACSDPALSSISRSQT